MTYCVGLKLAEGLVLLSDTRTNAGVDNVSRFKKMYTFRTPGERVIAMLCAGNLSISQGVMTRLEKAIEEARLTPDAESILNAETMFRAAQIVGETMREMQERHRGALQRHGEGADASIIMAGQRQGGGHRLFLIYAAGNFIEATADTPFFQIGEHKYGKPILDRVISPATPLSEAVKAALVSMDSTMRSNLSVGLPLDLAVIRRGALTFAVERRIEETDPDFAAIRENWSAALRTAFQSLPCALGFSEGDAASAR